MRVRIASALLAMFMFGLVAVAQDRVSLRPIYKAGDESRYSISALVETEVSAKGNDGIGGTSRRELKATVLVRTLSLTETGDAHQEAVVEAISFSSGKGASEPGEVAGKKIQFAISPSGYLLKCSIPDSRGYLALADLLFSSSRWRPAAAVAVGESWEAAGRGHLYTDLLSEISAGANSVYKLRSLTNGIASIEGLVSLNQNGSSVFNTGGSSINIGARTNGKGIANIDVDLNTGRVIGGTTESRVEGTIVSMRPTGAGEKLQPREGSLVESSRFSIKLIQ